MSPQLSACPCPRWSSHFPFYPYLGLWGLKAELTKHWAKYTGQNKDTNVGVRMTEKGHHEALREQQRIQKESIAMIWVGGWAFRLLQVCLCAFLTERKHFFFVCLSVVRLDFIMQSGWAQPWDPLFLSFPSANGSFSSCHIDPGGGIKLRPSDVATRTCTGWTISLAWCIFHTIISFFFLVVKCWLDFHVIFQKKHCSI